MADYYIYTITDPTNNKIIYVGQTTDPEARFKQHMYKNASRVYKRLLEIKNLNLKPLFTIIEVCDYKDVFTRESYWIDVYKETVLNGFVGKRPNELSFDLKIKNGVIIKNNKFLTNNTKNND